MTRFRPDASPHRLRASGDRWLFGYADIVTLLLACFASLYAATQAPASTDVAASEQAAVAQNGPAAVGAAAPAGADPAGAPTDINVPADMAEALAEGIAEGPAVDTSATTADVTERSVDDPAEALAASLRARFGMDPALPDLELSTSDRGLVLSVPEAGSFPPGQADLSAAASVVMLGLAAELRGRTNVIRVEGHTDDVPIRTARFGSNWELSTARATRVVQLLIEEGAIEPERLSAAGYAEFHPAVPNTSPANRARNRRVDIVVLDPAAQTAGAGTVRLEPALRVPALPAPAGR